jgi:hypothetical protein
MTNVLSIEERQVRDSEFVDDFINNGGNATQAAKTVGVSDGSASTVGHRMKNRLINNIEVAQKEALKGYSSKALNQIQALAESAVSEKVKLDANKDLLDRAGWKPIDKSHVTQANDWETSSMEELESELAGYHQEWMEKHLRSNNLKLVNASTLEEVQ